MNFEKTCLKNNPRIRVNSAGDEFAKYGIVYFWRIFGGETHRFVRFPDGSEMMEETYKVVRVLG